MSDDPIESILAAILMGKTKTEYGELTKEWSDYWDEVASEIDAIHASGGEVAFPSELKD